jgi:hypothetical protein
MCGQAEVGGQGIMACPDAAKLEQDVWAMEQRLRDLRLEKELALAEANRLRQILLIDGGGATACLTNQPITANPYPKPSEDWHLWRQGWERVEYKALATEMAHWIDIVKPLVLRVTLEDDNKPPSPEIARANELLARWDALRDGREYA